MPSEVLNTAAVIAGVGSLAVSGILWNVIKAYRERVNQLEDETKACQEHHLDNQERIKELEATITTIKDIPLQSIAKNQKEMLKTQKDILVLLKGLKA